MSLIAESENELAEGSTWWGVATLFRCEIEANPENVDIGLVGVPHSAGNGTSQRDQPTRRRRCDRRVLPGQGARVGAVPG